MECLPLPQFNDVIWGQNMVWREERKGKDNTASDLMKSTLILATGVAIAIDPSLNLLK